MAGNYPYTAFPAPDPGPQPYYTDGQGFCLNVGNGTPTRFGEFGAGEGTHMQSTLLRIRNERLHGGFTGKDVSGARVDGITHAFFDSNAEQVSEIEVFDKSIAELRLLPRRDDTAEFPFGMARQIFLNNNFYPPATGNVLSSSFMVWWKFLVSDTGECLDPDQLQALYVNATMIQPKVQIDVPAWDGGTNKGYVQDKCDPYKVTLHDEGALQLYARTEDQIPLPAAGDPYSGGVITNDRAWFTEPSIFYIGRSSQIFQLQVVATAAYPFATLHNTTLWPYQYFSIGHTVRIAANTTSIGGTWANGTASTTDYVEGVIVGHTLVFGVYTVYKIAQMGNSPDPSEVTLTALLNTSSVWMWETGSSGMSETVPGQKGSDPLFNFGVNPAYCAVTDEPSSTKKVRDKLMPATNWQHTSATPWDLAPTIRRNQLRPKEWGNTVHMAYSERGMDPNSYMRTYINKVTVDMGANSRILIDNFAE